MIFNRLSLSVSTFLVLFSGVVFSQTPADAGGEGTDKCIVFTTPGTSGFDISAAPDPVEGIVFPEGTTIGDITYTQFPIFDSSDPFENNWLFQLVDTLHIDTKEKVLRDQLLFRSGEAFSSRILDEAGRSLRDSNYLYDARVWPYQLCGERVDVEVLTREVWTLSTGFSLSRSGGADEESIWLSDSNFLGRGETFAIERTTSTDRDGFSFHYADPNVAGSRHTLDLTYADNDDGFQTIVDVQRPFYSLDTQDAWGLIYNDNERIDDLYDRGEEIASFQANIKQAEIYYGRSNGWQNGVTRRWWYGIRVQEEIYSPAEGETEPAVFPTNKKINYPFVAYNKIEENFIKIINLNNMHRIEDFNLGRTWGLRLGIADESFGSDRDRLVYSASLRDAWQLTEGILLQWEIGVDGMWQYDIDKSEDVQVVSKLRFYDGVGESHGTYLALDARWSRELPVNKQMLLGPEENLRGYPARYQSGDRSFVFTAEHRFYTDWHLFRLLRVGGAVFFDAGRAWFPGDENKDATGILADAGFGLRFASSRAQTKTILHVDIAFPFEKQDDIDSYQIVVTTKQSF
ncbi:MAG: BamA/TamA family outer membrane protein [Cellvibrionaceae bacterium]